MRKVGIPAVIVNNRLAIDQAAVLTSTKSRQRPVRLRIYTVDGRPSKVLIRAEGSEFELPKDQTLFNRFIKNSSVLIYEIIKVKQTATVFLFFFLSKQQWRLGIGE